MRRIFVLAGSSLALLSGCVPAPRPAPPAPRVPVPTPSPTPAPPPRPAPTQARDTDWRDWPLTPGTWVYRQDVRGSIALYGRAGEDADVTLRCDRARGRIYLSRRGDRAARLTIRTTSMVRALDALPTGGTPPYVAMEFGVSDPLLDAIGFSRGRFVIEGGGLPLLVVPAWPEILRVVEDCRG